MRLLPLLLVDINYKVLPYLCQESLYIYTIQNIFISSNNQRVESESDPPVIDLSVLCA